MPVSIMTEGANKYDLPSKKRRLALDFAAVAAGLLLGCVNGIFGAGGGMIAVPALTFVLKMEDKKAHATAIAVILPLCFISSIVYALRATFDFAVILTTGVGVFLGSLAGAALLKKIPDEWLAFVFYGLMLLAGIKMLV